MWCAALSLPLAVPRSHAAVGWLGAHLTPGVAAAAALAAAAVAVWILWRWRWARRGLRRLRRAPRPRYPVVLAHGFFGFDEVRIGGAAHGYFRGVRERLERDGWTVHSASVAKTASIAARAAELAGFVRAVPARRVNVVAHSMGGLDARYAISELGLGDKVASLTTVGTPHLGTPLADAGARTPLLAALARMGIEVDAIHDLTTDRMAEFNRAVPDRPGVAYASVVGAARRKRDVNPLLLPTFVWLGERAGPSDGVVPARSQRWGEVLREIEADHWAQIGWAGSRRFDAAEFYAELLRELRGRGF